MTSEDSQKSRGLATTPTTSRRLDQDEGDVRSRAQITRSAGRTLGYGCGRITLPSMGADKGTRRLEWTIALPRLRPVVCTFLDYPSKTYHILVGLLRLGGDGCGDDDFERV